VNRATFDFTDTHVLVTGGTSGIGLATASLFVDAGADVTITGTRPSADEYDVDLTRFTYRPLVLSDGEAIDVLVGGLDRLDVLVNNAGANLPGGRDEWQPDVFAHALEINLSGPMHLTTRCRPLLAASGLDGGASVVNIVSMSAFRAIPMVPGYASAKAGVVALTVTTANHWASDGIRVNAVAPGVIRTRMTAALDQIPELRDVEVAHTPMGRLGTPEEVAGVIAFLATREASFVTGATLAVDGGYLSV
jgi:NAD(P)-dependent dehydrogenase (short-subunit alcohol dehydrogenase family)